jgi:hypothetical protein
MGNTAAKKTTSNASRSGNPAKKATAQKVSSTKDFKSRRNGELLKLPSGLTVRARRVELRAFLKHGNVPNPLMEIVTETLDKGASMDVNKMVATDEGKIDLDMVNDAYDMVENLVMSCVVEPKVHPMPTQDDLAVWNEEHPDDPKDDPEQLLDDDLVYINDVDDEDKMFLFQWASGGTADVERFREEARTDMATLAEMQSAGSAPERSA